MEVVKTFTTVTDQDRLKRIYAATKSACDATLASLNLPPDSALQNNPAFLSSFASDIISQLAKAGIDHYNAIVGNALTRVFRYQKDSLVTVEWNDVVVLLYQTPIDPQYPLEEPVRISPEVLTLYSRAKRPSLERASSSPTV